MLSEKKWFNIAFYLLLCLSLWQVWQPAYFVTGDGPCHLHNAMAWKEMLLYKKSFYQWFYSLNPNISPNYFGHILLAFFTRFASPSVSEKLLISLYILLLCWGWLLLAKQLKSQTHAFLLLIFPFIFQIFLFLGFYNYILGIAGFIFLLALYLKVRPGLLNLGDTDTNQSKNIFILVLISLGSLLLYFIHVVGFALFVIGLFMDFGYRYLPYLFHAENRKSAIRSALALGVISLPGLGCLYYFSKTQPGDQPGPAPAFEQLFNDLIHLKFLTIFRHNESSYLYALFIFLFVSLFVLTIKSILDKRYTHGQHLITSLLLFCAGIYFISPDTVMGGEMLQLRFQSMIFLCLILLLSLHRVKEWIKYVLLFSVFIFSCRMILTKQENIVRMGTVVSDLQKLEPFIHDHSFIFPLSFHFAGVEGGKEISEELHYCTNHVAEYLHHRNKKLVFADNYEANTNYFPLIWKPEVNPFPYFPKAEFQPPEVNLSDYHSVHPIDYVLIFNLLPSDREHWTWKQISDQLKNAYHKVAGTETAELYARNTEGLPE